MSTEANRRVGAFIESEMNRLGLTRAEVLRRGNLRDNKTLQSAIEGKRRSTAATRGAIEKALDLDPGTLNAVERGEVVRPGSRGRVSDTELIAMLAERLSDLRRENDELRQQVVWPKGDVHVETEQSNVSPFDRPARPNVFAEPEPESVAAAPDAYSTDAGRVMEAAWDAESEASQEVPDDTYTDADGHVQRLNPEIVEARRLFDAGEISESELAARISRHGKEADRRDES